MNEPRLLLHGPPVTRLDAALIETVTQADRITHNGLSIVSTQSADGAHRSAVISLGSLPYLTCEPPVEIAQAAAQEIGILYMVRYLPVIDARAVIIKIHLYSWDPEDLIDDHEEAVTRLRADTLRRFKEAMTGIAPGAAGSGVGPEYSGLTEVITL